MDKGYIENGFIVDLTAAKKTSEIIYELSRVLDMPESKGKHICLKLGSVNLSEAELTSVKALVELMESQLAFISTSSTVTLESATALDNIFGEDSEPKEEKAYENETSTEERESTVEGKSEDDEISPIVRHDEVIAEKVEAQEVKEESDEEITALKNAPEALPTLYLRKTIRSGQSISSDGNIVIIGDVNPGSEIIAKGDITVWGILGGIAHAGSDGNNYAKIRALKLNPVQIRIGEVFARRPDTINLPYIQKSCEYIPEEAFTYNGSIVIRKIHEEN